MLVWKQPDKKRPVWFFEEQEPSTHKHCRMAGYVDADPDAQFRAWGVTSCCDEPEGDLMLLGTAQTLIAAQRLVEQHRVPSEDWI